jgi:hypothetical protein
VFDAQPAISLLSTTGVFGGLGLISLSLFQGPVCGFNYRAVVAVVPDRSSVAVEYRHPPASLTSFEL